MHSDLAAVSDDLALSTDVCVIGAGAAGIILTRRLLQRGMQVTLLESGGLDYEKGSARLNAGTISGKDYYALEDARLRFFGGTTAIWGGRCAELQPIDLEKREYVEGSGWPIEWNELQSYYDQARPLFELPERRISAADLAGVGVPLPAFDPALLDMPIWTFDRRCDRFAFANCGDLRSHPHCDIVVHATVTNILAERSGRQIEAIIARALNGRNLSVRARHFVLATGGLENARLLLASRSLMPFGLGNDHDQVGRYFMEHPHARGGRIVQGAAWPLLKAFARRHRIKGQDVAALITPSPSLQRRRAILNTSLTIVARQPPGATAFWGMKAYQGIKHGIPPTKVGRTLWMSTKNAAAWAQRHIDPLRPWLLNKANKLDLALLVRAEQAPNPNSRVTLTCERDALGVARLNLDWRLTALDARSVQILVETLKSELSRLNSGEVQPAEWLRRGREWETDPLVSSHPIGGYHHMGTTRMSDDPRHGVVDRHCRMHGIDNLHVAGSSVFPTSGWANPTLTIAALSLRLADRLANRASNAPANGKENVMKQGF